VTQHFRREGFEQLTFQNDCSYDDFITKLKMLQGHQFIKVLISKVMFLILLLSVNSNVISRTIMCQIFLFFTIKYNSINTPCNWKEKLFFKTKPGEIVLFKLCGGFFICKWFYQKRWISVASLLLPLIHHKDRQF